MKIISTLLHLRFPFSFFLLPIFLFALAVSPNFTEKGMLWTFLILHFLVYPASNGYNSYFDKDEKSIGGLKNPPPVNLSLYIVSLVLDAVAIVLAARISLLFAAMVLIYGLVSKAYSHPGIRLKKYPLTGWLVTGLFQGMFTFAMCYAAINQYDVNSLFTPKVLWGGAAASLMLWANYPLTQVYQHEEDHKRGDHTLSLKLGIRGTFLFTASFFTVAALAFVLFFVRFYQLDYAVAFGLALAPTMVYFSAWALRCWRNPGAANYSSTMWMNIISATSLNGYFIWLFLQITQLLQYLMP